MAESYWDSLRDWGLEEFDKTHDIYNLGPTAAEFSDWAEASRAYEDATGNDWVTGLPKEDTTSTSSAPAEVATSTYVPEEVTVPEEVLLPEPDEPSEGSLLSNTINDVLNTDNSLMRSASAQGLEYANSRGALNSDQAASASMSSMIDAAYPIAAGDTQAWQNYDATKAAYDIQNSQNSLNYTLQEMQNSLDYTLQTMQNDLQERLSYDANAARLTDSLINGMTSVFRTPDAVWTQDMQTDVENIINAYTPWAAGLYDIPLTGSLTA